MKRITEIHVNELRLMLAKPQDTEELLHTFRAATRFGGGVHIPTTTGCALFGRQFLLNNAFEFITDEFPEPPRDLMQLLSDVDTECDTI